jgi:hypothetical protein
MACRVRWSLALAGTLVGVFVLLGAPARPGLAQEGGAARLGSKDQSSESWELAAVFASGHRIFTRFSITNEGPGDRTGYALGQIVFPDGRVAPFQNGRLEGDWELSEDRLRMEIGSSVLDLHRPAHHFEVDKNKKGVKVFLDFEPGDAGARRWSDAPKGLNLDLLVLGAPVRGTIWVRDVMGEAEPTSVEGHLSLSHTWMDESEPLLTRRRIESHLLASKDGQLHAYALEVLPKGAAARRWLVVRQATSWHETGDFTLTASGEHRASKKDYPVPAELLVGAAGTAGGVTGRLVLGRQLVEHDPLEAAPRPFRWLLSFRTDPRQVWLDTEMKLEWAGPGTSLSVEGDASTSLYFTNPLED